MSVHVRFNVCRRQIERPLPQLNLDDGEIWRGVLRPSDCFTNAIFDNDTGFSMFRSGRGRELKDVQVINALDAEGISMVRLLDEKDVVVGRMEELDEFMLCCKRTSDVALEDADVSDCQSPSWTQSSSASPEFVDSVFRTLLSGRRPTCVRTCCS